MTISVEAAPPGLTLWRDCDENVLDLPGVAAGQRAAQGDPTALAKELYDAGVRRVASTGRSTSPARRTWRRSSGP
ncbi:MAG TPA: hypothetical protein VGM10_04020 [Actinocrinis sp.]|jgi:hypothetical protein